MLIPVRIPRSLATDWFPAFDRIFSGIIPRAKRAEDITVVFVSSARMRYLNRRYRGKDAPTDILSFSADVPGLLGELLLCQSELSRRARAEDETPNERFLRLIIHGALHLLNYDHETDRGAKRMEALEKAFQMKLKKQIVAKKRRI